MTIESHSHNAILFSTNIINIEYVWYGVACLDRPVEYYVGVVGKKVLFSQPAKLVREGLVWSELQGMRPKARVFMELRNS